MFFSKSFPQPTQTFPCVQLGSQHFGLSLPLGYSLIISIPTRESKNLPSVSMLTKMGAIVNIRVHKAAVINVQLLCLNKVPVGVSKGAGFHSGHHDSIIWACYFSLVTFPPIVCS